MANDLLAAMQVTLERHERPIARSRNLARKAREVVHAWQHNVRVVDQVLVATSAVRDPDAHPNPSAARHAHVCDGISNHNRVGRVHAKLVANVENLLWRRLGGDVAVVPTQHRVHSVCHAEEAERGSCHIAVICGAYRDFQPEIIVEKLEEQFQICQFTGVSNRIWHGPHRRQRMLSNMPFETLQACDRVDANAFNLVHRRAAERRAAVHRPGRAIVPQRLVKMRHVEAVKMASELQAVTEIMRPLSPHELEVDESSVFVEDDQLRLKRIVRGLAPHRSRRSQSRLSKREARTRPRDPTSGHARLKSASAKARCAPQRPSTECSERHSVVSRRGDGLGCSGVQMVWLMWTVQGPTPFL
eukprot:CAMPEP_0202107176 /NCGR_PEP_ID=MMETSP0965-20130614/15225_1 /ASSEMBLY_ACC=CAM_ASM_000507 /TAXON_ID=4773 /ORGANISM="Schizochytrium aggregatum, Strain ATCC28209" /LENGTH=357 /DNA_ID=CAMNT_0048676285 /DNA_START=131 /DNA_END=1202 /DNA_ORIENTATION=+